MPRVSTKNRRSTSNVSRRLKSRRISRRKAYRKLTTVNKTINPVGQRFITKLKYNDTFTVAPSTIPNTWTVNLNSIFDPDHTGTGHQPYGHDQLASIYGRYRVFAVRGKIRLSTLTGAPTKVVWLANNSSSPPSAGTQLNLPAEMPGSRCYDVQLERPAVINFKYSMNKITGVTAQQYKTDDRFQAQFGTNPSEKICGHLMYTSYAGTLTLYANVTLTYYVECFDPIDLSQS